MGSTEKDKTLKELFAEYGQSLTDSWGRETLLVDYQRFKALMIEWLEQKKHKLTYLTPDEMKMEKEMVNLQVVLGLQSCKTKQDVCELLEDIRQHERFLLIKEVSL